MKHKNSGVNGYILAGGKSSRIGEDKGLMILNNRELVKHVIDHLKFTVENITIVSNNREYEKFGYEVIQDIIKNTGPAGGIHTVLNHSHVRYNFVVSCDMPFINDKAIDFIIRNAYESEITVPVYKKRIEPLFGIYSRECLHDWTKLIDSNVIKLMDIIGHFKLLKVNVDNNEFFNDTTFININTNSDFINANNQFKNGN